MKTGILAEKLRGVPEDMDAVCYTPCGPVGVRDVFVNSVGELVVDCEGGACRDIFTCTAGTGRDLSGEWISVLADLEEGLASKPSEVMLKVCEISEIADKAHTSDGLGCLVSTRDGNAYSVMEPYADVVGRVFSASARLAVGKD